MSRILFLIAVLFAPAFLKAQHQVQVKVNAPEFQMNGWQTDVILHSPTFHQRKTANKEQIATFKQITSGDYQLLILLVDGDTLSNLSIHIESDTLFTITPDPGHILQEVVIQDEGSVLSRGVLRPVENMAIYAGKRTEVIKLNQVNANIANNNARQIYSKVAGLNIWESDPGGVQLGIGGRGLSPSRTANFNTRQNGYDIAADALGYPESYYTPAPEFIDRIEVVRGAASLQYGSQFGGLVNFRLKEGDRRKKVSGVTRVSGGSFGMLGIFNSLGGTLRKLNYYVGHLYKQADGWRENSAYHLHQGRAAVMYAFSKRFILSGEYTRMDHLAQQPGGLTDAAFTLDPQQSVRDRNWFKVQWNLASVTADWHITDRTRWQTRLFALKALRQSLGYMGQINRSDPLTSRDLINGDFRNVGVESRLLHHYKIKKANSVFLGGIRLYQGHSIMQQGYADNGSAADFRYLDPSDIDQSNYTFPSQNGAAFIENVIFLNRKWSVTPGLRAEWIRTSSEGYYYIRNYDLAGNVIYEEKVQGSSVRERSIFLAGLGVSYKPVKEMEVVANISQNYRAINFSDIAVVNPNFRIDPGIKDESGYTVDVGVRGEIGKAFRYDVSAFLLQYNDRIGEVLSRDTFSYTVVRLRTNIGESQNYGIESFAECDLIGLFNDSSQHVLSVFGNATWIKAFYTKSDLPGVEGKYVELVPEWMLRSGIEYRWKGLRISGNFSWITEQYSDATNATTVPTAIFGIIPEYRIFDASVSYEYKRWKIECNVSNLTDERYFTRRATGYPGPGILPSDGRGFYVTLQMKW